MKKALAIFTAVVLMPASQLMAFTGGPFGGNHAVPTGDDGVYEAIATMTNGVGLYRFAVRNNGTSSQAGITGFTGSASSNVQFSAGLLNAYSSNIWYYKGITYYGHTYGIANSDMRIVSAIGNATSNVSGGQATANSLPSLNGQVLVNPVGNNIAFANSSFIARMRDKGPTVRFSGRGQISFTGAADTVTRTETVTANSALNTTQTLTFPPQVIPGVITINQTQNSSTGQTTANTNTATSTGGEDSAFPQRGHVRKFLVFGTKVSWSVAP